MRDGGESILSGDDAAGPFFVYVVFRSFKKPRAAMMMMMMMHQLRKKNMHAYMLALHRIHLHGMCNRTCSPYFMHVYARSPHMFPHGTHQELRLLNKVADEKNVVRKSFLGPNVIQFNINFCELIILYSKNKSQYPIIYSMVLIPNPSRAYIPNHTASSCSEVCSLSPLGCSFQAGAFVAT